MLAELFQKRKLSWQECRKVLCIEKAFDSIWHKGLIFKLHEMKFPTYLIRIIESFSTGRSFVVDVGGAFSEEKAIMAGVPQGSVISPLLYNLYTSDYKVPRGNKVAFYADDSALISSGKVSNAIVKRMQKVLIHANEYFTKWKIKINNEKTLAIFFTFNKSPKRIPTTELSINRTEIPFLNSIKYLGVILDRKLTYREHVDNICIRAIRCGRALYPLLNRKSKLNTKNKCLLYNQCIKPILTYACVIWRGCASSDRKKL